jgi:hypothetical protein
MTPRASQIAYSLTGRQVCSMRLGAVCGQPAAELLMVSDDGRDWHSLGRCVDHPAREAVQLLGRVTPSASWVIVPLVKPQLLATPATATPGR